MDDVADMCAAFRRVAGAALLTALDGDVGTTIYGLGPNLTLAYVNPAWATFARANGGDADLAERPLGRSLESAIPPILRIFYLDALAQLVPGAIWEHIYECSSPTVLRKFRMRCGALAEPGYVVVSNQLLVEQPAPEAARYDHSGMLTQCAHCRRIRHRSGRWDWVPEMIEHPPAAVSHGLCPPCFEYHYPTSEPDDPARS